MDDGTDLRAVGDRIEQLLEEMRTSVEERVWFRIEELVRLLTDLYGAGLVRAVELAGDDGRLLRRMGDDELVGSLLMIHGLHPDDLEVRARQAVEAVAPSVQGKGGEVEIVGVDPASGVVRVAVTASTGGCGSTAGVIRDVVAQAVSDAVPDAAEVLVDLIVEPAPTETTIRLGRKRTAATTS